MSYDDHTVDKALSQLRERGITRTVHSTSNRAAKYRHVAPEVYELSKAELAVVSVLLLRGPQTTGELKSRTERQHKFREADDVATVLAALEARPVPLVRELERQPGQKDNRWIHLIGEISATTAPASISRKRGEPAARAVDGGPVLRVARACRDVEAVALQYATGLSLDVLAEWRDHAGFDGAVLGAQGGAYHFEFIRDAREPEPPVPHHESLIVLYIEADDEWVAACDQLVEAGFEPVVNANPYWEAFGRTFADIEGGRVVLHRGPWTS